MGNKKIPDAAESHVIVWYPFVGGIDSPHQGVVDIWSLFTTLIALMKV